MIPQSIALKGTTKANRYKIIDYISTVISNCSGWMTNHRMYSNMAISISFKIKVKNIKTLIHQLNCDEIFLSTETLKLLEELSDEYNDKQGNQEIFGAINITFIHNDKDLKIDVPHVPG